MVTANSPTLRAPLLGEPPDADDVRLVLRVARLGHQRHVAVVVDEADAREPLVGDALPQLHHVEVAEVHGPLGQGLVELHHQRLVLGPNRDEP